MNFILALPQELRLAVLAGVGACVGALANFAAAAYALGPRHANPWLDEAPPGLRRWLRRLPVAGWFVPPGLPLRPLVVELAAGFLFAWLYWWEVHRLALLPADFLPFAQPEWAAIVQTQYLAHALLLALMIVASLIDLDEKIIPDSVTISGTLIGLTLAAVLPQSLLPDLYVNRAANQLIFASVQVTSPHALPNWLVGPGEVAGLAVALGCFAAWGIALLPRTWYTRHGLVRAAALCLARVRRQRVSYGLGAMTLIGMAAIAGVWFHGGNSFASLLTALVGMAVGGGMIWSVRVVGFLTLRREAMGFGDVTLMAMIGAFLGWQACLVVFFLAPLAGLVVGAVQWLVARDNEIPYGPFLCLAALAVIVRWADCWVWLSDVLSLGWFVPLMLVACLLLMAVLLLALRHIRERFQRDGDAGIPGG